MTGVTITGADDAVNPEELGKLSAEFPFVEWGILFSSGRRGERRYPSLEWVSNLEKIPGLRLAAHFCGTWARALAQGDGAGLAVLNANPGAPAVASRFQRVQLNGFDASPPPDLRFVMRAGHTERMEFILQVRSPEWIAAAELVACAIVGAGGQASALYDASGGRGLEPARPWPKAPPGLRMGYAGGIRPSTVGTVLAQIHEDTGKAPPWVDMESGVRDKFDRMDLFLVREVLMAARSCMEIAA